MKVLYYDLTYPIGHKYFDEKTIENLSSITELTVLCPKNWYRKTVNNANYLYGAELLPYDKASTRRIFFNAIHNTKIAKHIAEENDMDAIVIGKFDHFSMPFVVSMLGSKRPLFVIHHNEIDQLNVIGKKGKIKRLFFDCFKTKVIHCVLEDFIKEYLVQKEHIKAERICCWPHPVERELNSYKNEGLFHCIGISTSNNQQFIKAVCDEERQSAPIKKAGYQVVLRSADLSFDNGNLKVYSGWISDEEYRHYFENALSVLIAFKDGYHYRVSASIFDAFSHHIPVLCTDMPLARYYHDKYPGICHIIQEDIVGGINEISTHASEEMRKEFTEFCSEHSDQIIRRYMRRDLERITNRE